jgi:hypothetical protein
LMMMAPVPANTRAKVPNNSAASLRMVTPFQLVFRRSHRKIQSAHAEVKP